MASNFGHLDVVKLLISKGADANSKDKVRHSAFLPSTTSRLQLTVGNVHFVAMQKGESALMLACGKGYVDIAKVLLEHGANVDHQSKVSFTPNRLFAAVVLPAVPVVP